MLDNEIADDISGTDELTTAFLKLRKREALSEGCHLSLRQFAGMPRQEDEISAFWRRVVALSSSKHVCKDEWDHDVFILEHTSSALGAATRISRQRLLMGAISLLVLLAHSIILMLVMYFSIVLRRAA